MGKAAAKLFYDKGWNIIATMRNPEKETELKEDKRLKLVRLDVQDKPSIENAVKQGIATFGKIDVFVNNAGYATFGPLEAGTDEEIRKQFDVNFFGVIDCMKAILPHFKQQKEGTIINVTSGAGFFAFPLLGLYDSSKFALEGLSEGLWFDWQQFGIKVKL